MWFGKPGDPSIIPPLLAAIALASVGVGIRHRLQQRDDADPGAAGRIGRLSGTGWATGYIGGIVSLIIVLGFLAANPETGARCSASRRCSGSTRSAIRATASPDR
jgi:UMF1 family MFS transporter